MPRQGQAADAAEADGNGGNGGSGGGGSVESQPTLGAALARAQAALGCDAHVAPGMTLTEAVRLANKSAHKYGTPLQPP